MLATADDVKRGIVAAFESDGVDADGAEVDAVFTACFEYDEELEVFVQTVDEAEFRDSVQGVRGSE